jgi:phytoene dehydrogenase-like protein
MMHLLPPGHPKGGSGMLSEALQTRLESYGGRVRLGDGAAAITTAGGRATGVLTESGEHLPAGVVVTGCHVLTTVDLLGDGAPGDLATRAHRSIRTGNGIGMVVRLGTSALPQYAAGTDETHRSMQLIAPSRQFLRKAHGEYSAGLPPEHPAALAMTFSAFDDTIAPPGKHNVTVWGQWHPYELSNGERWDDIREREGTKLVEAVDRVAPGFASSVEHMHVQTPLDLERELGLRNGQVMHVEMAFDQMFMWRPMPELAGYTLPGVDGLYLCGASTHPGGGVFGASGRSAAGVALGRALPQSAVPSARSPAPWLTCSRCCWSTAATAGTPASSSTTRRRPTCCCATAARCRCSPAAPRSSTSPRSRAAAARGPAGRGRPRPRRLADHPGAPQPTEDDVAAKLWQLLIDDPTLSRPCPRRGGR